MRPKKPVNVKAVEDKRSIQVSWEPPKALQMANAPKLAYRVRYISKWMDDPVTLVSTLFSLLDTNWLFKGSL